MSTRFNNLNITAVQVFARCWEDWSRKGAPPLILMFYSDSSSVLAGIDSCLPYLILNL